MASHWVDGLMSKIESRYNAEYDTPPHGQPPVTWAEHSLMMAVRDLQEQISALQDEVERLQIEPDGAGSDKSGSS